MKTTYLLHSGFVTTDATKLLQSVVEDKGIRGMLTQPPVHGNDPTGYYDEEVTNLFNQWRKDEDLIRSFDFREKALKIALRAFDTINLAEWIQIQLNQGTVRYLHRRFLKEMMAYINAEEPKTMDNYQYYRLLSREPSSQKFPDTNSPLEIDDSYLKAANGRDGHNLPSLLALWTRDMDGLSDMISTLNVIFGRRAGTLIHVVAT